MDLATLLAQQPAGVDLDPRGDTCWLVLLDGEQIGWVRLNNGGLYSATAPGWVDRRWKQRRGRNAANAEFDDFNDAVSFVADHRHQVDNTRGRQ